MCFDSVKPINILPPPTHTLSRTFGSLCNTRVKCVPFTHACVHALAHSHIYTRYVHTFVLKGWWKAEVPIPCFHLSVLLFFITSEFLLLFPEHIFPEIQCHFASNTEALFLQWVLRSYLRAFLSGSIMTLPANSLIQLTYYLCALSFPWKLLVSYLFTIKKGCLSQILGWIPGKCCF